MSIRKRKKVIQKVVKLLNLATSNNPSESTMALRHAESLIRQYEIAQKELPILQLCDRSMLYRVSWGVVPRYHKESSVKSPSEGSVYQRRFSEKNNDPSRAYESARTILDDMGLSDESDSLEGVGGVDMADSFSEEDIVQVNVQGEFEGQDASVVYDEVNEQEMTEETGLDESGSVDAMAMGGKDSSASAYAPSSDNVINATRAFRPGNHEFTETLKTQYATSDPNVPFAEDDYWSSVYEKLADFDETKLQTEIDTLDKQLSLAQENLHVKKQKRYEHEQGEILERTERARIEQSFEEAIERAFQARAKSYESWEESCTKIRISRLRDEQGGSGF